MKDSGVVESCMMAHFDCNSLSFDNMEKSVGNGPAGNLFNVAISESVFCTYLHFPTEVLLIGLIS